MREFHDGDGERERRKQAELAPYIEQAMKRKQRMRELRDDEIPVMHALGRQIVQQQVPDREKAGSAGGLSIPLEDPVGKT